MKEMDLFNTKEKDIKSKEKKEVDNMKEIDKQRKIGMIPKALRSEEIAERRKRFGEIPKELWANLDGTLQHDQKNIDSSETSDLGQSSAFGELQDSLSELNIAPTTDDISSITDDTAPITDDTSQKVTGIINIGDKKIILRDRKQTVQNRGKSEQRVTDFDLSKNPVGFRPDSRTIPNEFATPTEETTLRFLEGAKETNPSVLTFTKGNYTYIVNTKNETARKHCAETLSKNTQRSFDWFKERTGKERWVLYDTNQYDVLHHDLNYYLHFNDSYRGVLELPVNASSCHKMFAGCDVSWVSFSHAFDTRDVITMFGMFVNAIYKRPHVLYLTFNTANVEDMSYMFFGARFSSGLKLAGDFTTKKVKTMERMFSGMMLNENIEFSNSIDTSCLINIEGMFSKCNIKSGFTFPERFNTENVVNFSYCFCGTVFPEHYKLNKTFSTISGKNFSHMFADSTMPKFSNIISEFNTKNGTDFSGMFFCARLPVCFKLPETFYTDNAITMYRMFYGCNFTDDFFIPECFTTTHVQTIYNMFANCNLGKAFALPESFAVEHIKDKRFVFSNSKGFMMDPDVVGIERVVRKFHKKYVRMYK